MSNWWIILIIVALVAAGFFFLRSRREVRDDVIVGAESTRDYDQEREDGRDTKLSDEDRAWQAASQQKNRETQEQKPPSPPAS